MEKVDTCRIPATTKKMWQMIADCIAGQQAIKDAGESYLPKPNPNNKSQESKAFYEQYLQRACFYNVTGRTAEGMTGIAFDKETDSDLGKLDYLITNADGAGVGLDQLAQKAVAFNLRAARGGFLTTYPDTGGKSSKADNITASIKLYRPESIINWDTDVVNGKQRLVLVVLHEQRKERKERGFSYETIDQWRVLRILNDLYVVDVFEKEKNGSFKVISTYFPKDANNRSLTDIPFQFFGSQNNDTELDKIPLLDLAFLNISHYQNSADIEESSFFTGQATPVFKGLREQGMNKEGDNNVITLGARSPILLDADGDAHMLQTSPDQLPLTLMERKEQQMVALGARLVESPSNITATAVKSNDRATYSVLKLCCTNVSAAINQCLKWCADFNGVSGKFTYSINTEFITDVMTAQQVSSLIQLWQTETIAKSDAHKVLKKAGLLSSDRTSEDIEQEIRDAMP